MFSTSTNGGLFFWISEAKHPLPLSSPGSNGLRTKTWRHRGAHGVEGLLIKKGGFVGKEMNPLVKCMQQLCNICEHHIILHKHTKVFFLSWTSALATLSSLTFQELGVAVALKFAMASTTSFLLVFRTFVSWVLMNIFLNRCSIGPSPHHKLDHFMFKLANLLSFNLFQVLLIFISATPWNVTKGINSCVFS